MACVALHYSRKPDARRHDVSTMLRHVQDDFMPDFAIGLAFRIRKYRTGEILTSWTYIDSMYKASDLRQQNEAMLNR